MLRRARWWILPMLAVAGVGAAPRSITLSEAVKAGDTKAVTALLKSRADVNATEVDGTTALHWAAYGEAVETVKALIRAGANVNALNRYGATPLSLACTNGNAAVVQQLLEAGADANGVTPGGETALMTASRSGNPDAVRALVEYGADVTARESTRGQTALMWAAGEGHAEAIKVLLDAGADVHATSHEPAAASVTGSDKTWRRSVKRLDVFTPLLFAVRADRIEAARALLAGGANVNETASDGTSAVVIATYNAHWDMAAFLLEQGADPNAAKQGWTALHQLMRTRSLNIGFYPQPEQTGHLSSLELAEKLMAHGADVNARITRPISDAYRGSWGQNGATPLLQAAHGADFAMMRLLIAHGADPKLTNAKGTTALMLAAGVEMFNPNEDAGTNEESLESVKIALATGADVNAANKDGDTPLHGAAFRGANEVVQLLVDKGATLDVKNKRGLTPLMTANGDEDRIANINVKPWTVELLQKLLRERGLPADVQSKEARYAFEKGRTAPKTNASGQAPRARTPDDDNDDSIDAEPQQAPAKKDNDR